ncbi:MAG: tRNA (adenosine(37)-N6)-dimethylallyltransferase MiaA [Rikenellaceae bacterium]
MLPQNNTPTRRLIVVVGPTASGKSSLSIALAQHFEAPIISTDSRQLYRGIPIGTAQPTTEELAAAEHHFIACRELSDDYNAGVYEHDAVESLNKLFEQHSTVVAVGGSGLYIQALCEGLDSLPEVDAELRESIRCQYAEEGLQPLLDELQRCDPECYERVDRCNPSRVMRAIEVCRTSADGRYSSLRTTPNKVRDFEIVKIGLDLPRELLYRRIDDRVEQMVAEGLEAEARSVYPLRHLNSLQTVGYREIFAHFDGEYDLPRAIELIQRNTRRYAKRQMTWFRRDSSITWFTSYDPPAVIKWLEATPCLSTE